MAKKSGNETTLISCPHCRNNLAKGLNKGYGNKVALMVISCLSEKKDINLTLKNYWFCQNCNRIFIIYFPEEGKSVIYLVNRKGAQIILKELRALKICNGKK